MKNLKFLTAVAFSISLVACSSDDNNDNNNSGGIEGTYNLTEFNTSAPTDFNDDGVESTNQMNESNCYNEGELTFRSDNTFDYTVSYISVNLDGSSTCTSYEVDGTWTASNNTITATYENLEGNDTTINFARSNNGNTLTETRVLTTYPDRNNDGGAINAVGTVTLVYNK